MHRTINIVLAVDVIEALSSGSLESSLHMMDDGPLPGSNQGTASLTTYCWPGWTINWTIQQIDLQTPATIRNIRFEGAGPLKIAEYAGNTNVWSGIVPAWLVPRHPYRYEVEVQMARGTHSVLAVRTPSLVVPS